MNFAVKGWSRLTLQAQLMIISTLLVSIIMSGLSFWALNSIKQETTITDKNFVQDLTLLLTTNVIPLIEGGLYEDLVNVSKGFYNSTSSIRYIIYLDDEGEIYHSIPLFRPEKNFFLAGETISKNLEIRGDSYIIANFPNTDAEVTNIFLDLYSNDLNIGYLILGLNPNPTIVNSSRLTIHLSVTIFFSIWLIVVFGAAFNTLIIDKIIHVLFRRIANKSQFQH